MKWKVLFRGKREKELFRIETRLDTTFQPIGPSQEFVNRLRGQLVAPTKKGLFGLNRAGWTVGIAVVGVFVGVVILFQSSLRLIISLLGALGILSQTKRIQAAEQQDSSGNLSSSG